MSAKIVPKEAKVKTALSLKLYSVRTLSCPRTSDITVSWFNTRRCRGLTRSQIFQPRTTLSRKVKTRGVVPDWALASAQHLFGGKKVASLVSASLSFLFSGSQCRVEARLRGVGTSVSAAFSWGDPRMHLASSGETCQCHHVRKTVLAHVQYVLCSKTVFE